MAETRDAIDQWLTDGQAESDGTPESYRTDQQTAYSHFFAAGKHIVHKAISGDEVVYAPIDMGKRTVVRQPESDPEEARVVLAMSSRVIESMITPRITAYEIEIEPGQSFDPLAFNPDEHTPLRAVDLPNDTPWLHRNPDWPQLEGRPTMEDVANVALFDGILSALASVVSAGLDPMARRALY